MVAWLMAPPSSSRVTSSPVTVFTTSGPVMNMWLVWLTMKMKSVMAGEYTAPPAHGPMITLIWGMTPEAVHVAMEDPAVGVQRHHAFLDAGPGAVVQPDHGHADGLGQVHDLVDLLGEHLAQRAAEDGEVLAEDAHPAAVDRCRSR